MNGWKNVMYIYNEILFVHKKEWNPAIYSNMDMDLEGIMLTEIS